MALLRQADAAAEMEDKAMTYQEAVKAARQARLGYTNFTRLFVFTYLQTDEWHWGVRVPVWGQRVEAVLR